MTLEKLQINFESVLKKEDVKSFLLRARTLGYDEFIYQNIDEDVDYLYDVLIKRDIREVVVWENGNISWGGLDGDIKTISLNNFINEVETFKVDKNIYDLIQAIKDHNRYDDSIPLYSLTKGADHEKASELASIIDDELDPIVLRYILGDKSIAFETDEERWLLAAIDQYGDEAFFTIDNGLPRFTYFKNDAVIFKSREEAELQKPSDDFQPIKL